MVKYKLSDQQISTSLLDESVILNHSKGEYYGLNEIGTKVWDFIKESPRSIQDLVSLILAEYDVEESQCTVDIENLLEELLNEKLIEKTN